MASLRRPARRTISVDVETTAEIEVSEIVHDIELDDLVAIVRAKGGVCFERSDLEELSTRIRGRDFEGALLLLDQLMPPGFRLFSHALGPQLGSARP